MKPIEQFREHGLSRPIRIGPGLRSYLFLLLGGPFLVGGSVLALMQGGPVVFLAGLIGLPFFGFAFLIYLIVLLRSQRRGLLPVQSPQDVIVPTSRKGKLRPFGIDHLSGR